MEMEQEPGERRGFTAPIVALLCSIVLACRSCYGFLSKLNINGSGKHAALNMFFLVIFGLCVMVFPGTIIWMIARAIRNRKSGGEAGQ